MATFKHLFTPIQVGHVTIRNRIVSTPHATRFGSDGYITERYIRYHAEKAKGGAGLVQCFGSMGVHPTAPVADWNGIKNFDDSSLPTFTAFAAGVHKHGAHVMAQITHRGRRGSSVASGIPLQAPSDIPERHHNEIPHEIEKEMIAEIVRAYAAAALRLKRAGFDGADLAGFARHLIDQFWVPSVNRRTDEYGGSFENRMRFGVEVVQAIRAAVGRDFILGMRVTGDELVENGLGLEEMVEIVRYYNDLRLLDYFTVTGSTGETVRHTAMLMPFANAPHAVYAPFAARIREVVDVPIIYVGRVVDPLHADRLIDEGVCDLVAMTRALIADPHMPRKAMEGRLDDIRACLGMQDGCLGGGLVSCSQNPVTGREEELAEIVPAAVRKKVVVVGGGPAGLEAARVAALRGHVVVLYEKGPELGGQVLVAGRAPLRPAYDDSVRWLARQVAKTGVTVHLGTEATVETVLAERPDAVVIATGAAPWVPELPGVELPGVCTVSDILQGSTSAGRRCVVVDNTGTVQAGLAADFLAKQGHEGREVIAVTPYHMLCEGMGASTKEPLYAELYAGNVVVTPDTDLKAIEAVDGTGKLRVWLQNEYTGRKWAIEDVDTVVLSWGGKAVDGLYRALKGQVPELVLVGDAMAPRRLQDAILEGTRAARKI